MLFNKLFVFILLFVFQANSNGSILSYQGASESPKGKTINTIIKVCMKTVGTATDEYSSLKSDSLAYSSAVVVLTDYDKEKRIYWNRTLVNIYGGNLEEGINQYDADKIFGDLKTLLSNDKEGKVYFIAGRDSQNDNQIARTMRQENSEERKYILDLFNIKGIDTEIAGSMELQVMPDGKIELSEPNAHDRGFLTLTAKEEILQKCKDD